MGKKSQPTIFARYKIHHVKILFLNIYITQPRGWGGNSPMGKGVWNTRVPPSVYIPVVGIRLGTIEVSNEKSNITLTVDHKEVHTGEKSLSNDMGLRVVSVSARAPFHRRYTCRNSSKGKEEIGHGGTSYQQPFLGLYTKLKAMCALIRVSSNIASAHSWAKHQFYITQLIMLVDIKCLWQPRTQSIHNATIKRFALVVI